MARQENLDIQAELPDSLALPPAARRAAVEAVQVQVQVRAVQTLRAVQEQAAVRLARDLADLLWPVMSRKMRRKRRACKPPQLRWHAPGCARKA